MRLFSTLLICFSVFLMPQTGHTKSIPLEFIDVQFGADLKIILVDNKFEADQKWYVTGTCPTSINRVKIFVVDNEFSADKKIMLLDQKHGADHEICLGDPKNVPLEFYR